MSSILHSTDTLTFGGDAKPDQIAEVLQALGVDRNLDLRTAGDRLAVTVPGVNVTSLPAAVNATADHLDCRLVPQFVSGTHIFFQATGKPSPHGFEPEEIGEGAKAPMLWESPPAGKRRPVVALFDYAVDRAHPWLPQDPTMDPFVIDAERPPQGEAWQPGPLESKPGDRQDGHGTFIAGLIRQTSPFAQVLSVRVMGNGKVNEHVLTDALAWLLRYKEHSPVDVLLMAFGRAPGDFDDLETLAKVKEGVDAIHGQGIKIVASAGNDHDDAEVFPAAWENVTAVGSGKHPKHYPTSNYGSWVDQYRDGKELVSILPVPQLWGTWSGTSFAAALLAAELAEPHDVG